MGERDLRRMGVRDLRLIGDRDLRHMGDRDLRLTGDRSLRLAGEGERPRGRGGGDGECRRESTRRLLSEETERLGGLGDADRLLDLE